MIFNLLRKMTDKSRAIPRSVSEIGDYKVNFEQAVDFTSSCGFEVHKPIWTAGDALDPEGSFIEPPLRRAGVTDTAKSAGQCLKWCHYLAPEFEKQLGRPVWVTVGQLWKDNSAVFSPTWDELRRWSTAGIKVSDIQHQGRSGVNLHAWLTIDSGEIVDLTFLSTLAKFADDAYARFAGAVVWGRDPGMLNGHRYYPMATGRAFVEAVGRKSEIPLLASNAAELQHFSAVLVATGFD